MSKKRLLFALAGAGAGNFSRVTAILEELDQSRFEVALLAQSHARQWAKTVTRYPLLDVTYGAGDFTAWQVLRHNASFPLRYWRNRRLAGRALDEFRPDLLVVDSDFYSLPEARRRGIPILSINSSPATLAVFRRMAGSAADLPFSYCIERIDRRLQRCHADRILCPVLGDVDTGLAKVQLLSPIVRRQFRHPVTGTGTGTEPAVRFDVGVMLGGSGIGASMIDLRRIRSSMVVVGAAGGQYPAHALRLPFTDRPASYLARCRVMVIQGGFNSVSEAIALGKPTVIVPIPNHVEQLVNASWAQELGLAVMARGDQIGAVVNRLLEQPDASCAQSPAPRACDGSIQAAGLIAEMAGA